MGQWSTDKVGRDELRVTIQVGWDSGDKWGSGMGWLGGACDALAFLGRRDLIPDSAGYQVGAGGPNPHDTHEGDEFMYHIVHVDRVTVNDVSYWAHVMDRYCDLIRAAGKDY